MPIVLNRVPHAAAGGLALALLSAASPKFIQRHRATVPTPTDDSATGPTLAPATATSPRPIGTLSAPPSAEADRSQSTTDAESSPRTKNAAPVEVGGQVEIGFPDGLTAAASARVPAVALSANAGLSYNTISPGVRLGLDWQPLRNPWIVSAHWGHYFQGNGSHWASSPNNADYILLEKVGYTYWALRTGVHWPLGGVQLVALVGFSHLRAPIEQVERVLDPDRLDLDADQLVIRVPETPILTAWLPSVTLGIRGNL